MLSALPEDSPSPSALAFPWPDDAQAWWALAAALLGGWRFAFGPRLDPAGLALACSAIALFLASEWVSHLSGRARIGEVHPEPLSQPWGWALLTLSAAGLAVALWRLGPRLRPGWAPVLTGVACLVALLFVLRLEWVALDGRLLVLTHLLLTLPVPLLGFIAHGVGSPLAFQAWALPLFYFPCQALYALHWMHGRDAPPQSLSHLAAPLLAGVLIQASLGHALNALLLAAFTARAVQQLFRRRQPVSSLPSMSSVRRFGRELQAWDVAMLLGWLLS